MSCPALDNQTLNICETNGQAGPQLFVEPEIGLKIKADLLKHKHWFITNWAGQKANHAHILIYGIEKTQTSLKLHRMNTTKT